MLVHLGRDPRTDPGCTQKIPQEELLPGKLHVDQYKYYFYYDYVFIEIRWCAEAGNV